MRTQIIAEVASGHGGSLELAKLFVARCAEAGADFVKFQSWRYEDLGDKNDPQAAWFKQAELTDDMHHALIECCQAHGVKFLTSVFSASRVPFLTSLGLEAIKVGSGDAHKGDLAVAVIKGGFSRIFVSDGGETNLQWYDCSYPVQWLSAVPLYPAPSAACALADVRWDGSGYSDHTEGVHAAAIAIAMGAPVVEVHVQIPEQARRSQVWEKTMHELKELVEWAKIVEQVTTAGEAVDLSEAKARYQNRWK